MITTDINYLMSNSSDSTWTEYPWWREPCVNPEPITTLRWSTTVVDQETKEMMEDILDEVVKLRAEVKKLKKLIKDENRN